MKHCTKNHQNHGADPRHAQNHEGGQQEIHVAFKTFALKHGKEIEKKPTKQTNNLGLPPVPLFGGNPDPDGQVEKRMQSL